MDLMETIYMCQPAGFVTDDFSLMCKLNKALYGLKKFPRAWKLYNILHGIGFQNSKANCWFFLNVLKSHFL